MKKLLPLIILSLGIHFARAQEPKEIVKNFFQQYESNIATAIDDLFRTNPTIYAGNKAAVESAQQALSKTPEIYGAYSDWRLIEVQCVAEDLCTIHAVAKHKEVPLRFKFLFYRCQEDWKILKFQYDDSFADELIDKL